MSKRSRMARSTLLKYASWDIVVVGQGGGACIGVTVARDSGLRDCAGSSKALLANAICGSAPPLPSFVGVVQLFTAL